MTKAVDRGALTIVLHMRSAGSIVLPPIMIWPTATGISPTAGADEREAERRLAERQSIDRRLPYGTVPTGGVQCLP